MQIHQRAALVAIGVVLAVATGHAQLRRPKAELTTLVERDAVQAGADARAAVQVTLPEGLHVQSDKPREKSLIATVLTIDAPAGVTVSEIVYPPSIDLKQAGLEQPLAVFEREFAIGARFALAGGLPPGDIVVPAHLRYQACDSTMCYLPLTAETSWTLHVAPSGQSTPAGHGDVFERIQFGHGEQPGLTAANPNSSPIRNPQSAMAMRSTASPYSAPMADTERAPCF